MRTFQWSGFNADSLLIQVVNLRQSSKACGCELTGWNKEVALEGRKNPILKWQPWTEPTQGSPYMEQGQRGCSSYGEKATSHSEDEPEGSSGWWSWPPWTSKKPVQQFGDHSHFFFLFVQTWDIVKTPVRLNEPVYLAVLQVVFLSFHIQHSVMITTNSLRHQGDYLLKRPNGSASLLCKSTIIEDKGRNTMSGLLPRC